MSDGPVVINAGPLIALSTVGRLDVLASLYGRVMVPDAVVQEVVIAGAGRVGAREVALGHWQKARLVLLDDRRARRIAEYAYGLRVKGTAGILVAAKRAGLPLHVRPLLEAMLHKGYFLSARLLERACREAGE